MKLIAVVFLVAVVGAAGCGGEVEHEKPLVCHVGGTMRPVMQKLAQIYEDATGQKVEINSAGSGELLAHIELQKEGDLYVCHDPFLDILMKKFKMGVDGWVLAELTPVIVVRKGNPKKIKGLQDLTRPDVDLWLTDYKRSSLGRMLKTIFTKAGIDFEKLNRDKKISMHKSGGHVANVVKTGNADAAVVWNAVAHLRLDGLDIVYSLAPVCVTLATLKCAREPEAAREFAEFVASPESAKVFKDFGFTMRRAGKKYEDGREIKR